MAERRFVWGEFDRILRASLISNTIRWKAEVSGSIYYVTKSLILTVIMATEPHAYIATCVQRCDDHAILCETWTLYPPRAVFQGKSEREQCGRRCVTGLVPENLSQPLPPELLRRLQKGTTLAARFPSTKPSTWASQALAPHQDEERKENACFTVSPPASLHLG